MLCTLNDLRAISNLIVLQRVTFGPLSSTAVASPPSLRDNPSSNKTKLYDDVDLANITLNPLLTTALIDVNRAIDIGNNYCEEINTLAKLIVDNKRLTEEVIFLRQKILARKC